MKKFLAFTFVAMSMMFFSGCNKEDENLPNVDFETVTDENSLTVEFDNLTTLADSYLWDFGDGMTSDFENPTHSYSTPGTKTVTLTAYNNYGEKSVSKSFTLATPSGKLKMVNQSEDPYMIYIDGAYQTNIDGRTYKEFTLAEGDHTVRVLQISGYAIFATDETYNITIIPGYITTKNFPYLDI